MKHIKIFEEFINESVDWELKLQIINKYNQLPLGPIIKNYYV